MENSTTGPQVDSSPFVSWSRMGFADHPAALALVAGAVLFMLVAPRLASLKLDPREPPLLRPTVPFIGHYLGLVRHGGEYHGRLREKSPMPIATLPMLNGKTYYVWDPVLIQSLMKSKSLSFQPFVAHHFAKVGGIPRHISSRMFGPSFRSDAFNDGMHQTMLGRNLLKMNVAALGYVARRLNTVAAGERGLEIPNVYSYMRDLLSTVTTVGLYGKRNPFEEDPGLIADLWSWFSTQGEWLVNPFIPLTKPEVVKSRQRLQKALQKYYGAGTDSDADTAAVLKYRADEARKAGITGPDVGMLEIILPGVATVNTAPTFFWTLQLILSKPGLVDRLRDETMGVAESTRRDEGSDNSKVMIDISKLEGSCPLLVSTYKEAIRMVNTLVAHRIVLEDTTATDSQGEAYLLKKGVEVELTIGLSHVSKEVWGGNVKEFEPERFLKGRQGSTGEEKMRKAAYLPFGAGKHLCPGRKFADAEILGTVALLLMGFDFGPLEGYKPIQEARAEKPDMVQPILKTVDDGKGVGARLTRRSGWEHVEWEFGC